MQTDYSAYADADWWPTEFAIKLCAGWHSDNGTLRHASNVQRTAALDILAAWRSEVPLVKKPLERTDNDGRRFVRPVEFVNWLSAHCAAVAQPNPCPVALARLVAAVRDGSQFESLAEQIDKFAGRRFSRLPKSLQKTIPKTFSPFKWDDLSPAERRSFAIQRDDQHRPEEDGAREFLFDFSVRLLELEASERELIDSGSSSRELTEVQTRIRELRARMNAADARSQLDPHQLEAWRSERLRDYVSFPKALEVLQRRLQATPEEVAQWVALGPEFGGLAGFNGKGPKPAPFSFERIGDRSYDYVSRLSSCWFFKTEIEIFQPGRENRFITGRELIRRWTERLPQLNAHEFITAKISEDSLVPFHPVTGLIGVDTGNPLDPPIEAALFSVAAIDQVETDEFPTDEDDREPVPSATCTSEEIIQAFRVYPEPSANEKWWRERLEHAKDSGLAACRVGEPRRGLGQKTLWRPLDIATWLVDRRDNPRAKGSMTRSQVRKALLRWPQLEAEARDRFSMATDHDDL